MFTAHFDGHDKQRKPSAAVLASRPGRVKIRDNDSQPERAATVDSPLSQGGSSQSHNGNSNSNASSSISTSGRQSPAAMDQSDDSAAGAEVEPNLSGSGSPSTLAAAASDDGASDDDSRSAGLGLPKRTDQISRTESASRSLLSFFPKQGNLT